MMSWLKKIPSALLQKDSSPLIGFPPPFPWKEFSEKLGQLFELNPLVIKPENAFEWRESENLLKGLGENPKTLAISMAPQGGACWFTMPRDDIYSLMSLLLSQDISQSEASSNEFLEGFHHFLALETIGIISACDFAQNLSFHIIKNEIPQDTLLTLNISIQIQNQHFWGRLIFSNEIQQQWKEHFAERSLDIPIANMLDIDIIIEAGHIKISLADWSKVSPGDFITTDFCSLKPSGEGRVLLTAHGIPLFRGRVKEGNIKLLELSLYHNKVEHSMNELPSDQGDDQENTPDEEVNHEVGAETEHPHTEQEQWPPPPEARPHVNSNPATEAAEPNDKPTSPGEIPLTIIVEVGRIQMSVKKLLELQPGNVLDLSLHPENGVDLIVNGKRIAKGELLLIGETLGIRILDIS